MHYSLLQAELPDDQSGAREGQLEFYNAACIFHITERFLINPCAFCVDAQILDFPPWRVKGVNGRAGIRSGRSDCTAADRSHAANVNGWNERAKLPWTIGN
ncbi:hypothetical protein [Pelagibacterium montanilacus]|uniref:hypothetical protein n=1 Tax=Pelagibacterium montanilacus TaxID=2185280 RepID=UPI0013E05EF3|nr:hypothetical protein [Pelagibacterium montanilacus]